MMNGCEKSGSAIVVVGKPTSKVERSAAEPAAKGGEDQESTRAGPGSVSQPVDGMTWKEYDANLARNLVDLHALLHRGAYRALPSRLVYIPKPDNNARSRSPHSKTRSLRGGAHC